MTTYNNRMMYPAQYHQCPVTPCEKQINYQLAMCRQHWTRVPFVIQSEVYAAWNRGNPTPEHPAILRVAVEAVNEQFSY